MYKILEAYNSADLSDKVVEAIKDGEWELLGTPFASGPCILHQAVVVKQPETAHHYDL